MAEEKITKGDEIKKKPRYTDYETPEGRSYLTYLYRDRFMTDQQVADEIGITRRTLINWRNRSKIIADACSVGKQTVDTMVENALLQQALKGNIEACKYWLNNRKREKWRPIWNEPKDSKAGGEHAKAQTVAIAEMINNPEAERVLTDFLTPRKDEEKEGEGE